MKKIIFSLLTLALIGGIGQAQTWKVDPAHSSILFSAKHSGISFVHGRFDKFEATVEGGSKEDFTGATVSFTAQVESINTNAAGRDRHLKSDDFFDMENHPTVTFTSKSFTKSGGNTYTVTGDLTMRGNTKEVELVAEHIGSTKARNGNDKVGFQIKGTVDRNEWGVSGAGGSVAPMIEIVCNVEMSVQN